MKGKLCIDCRIRHYDKKEGKWICDANGCIMDEPLTDGGCNSYFTPRSKNTN